MIQIMKKLGKQNVGILHDANPYGTTASGVLQAEGAKAGLKFTGVEKYGGEDRDMSPQLTKLKNAGSDLLAIIGVNPAPTIATKQVKQLGINLPIITTSASNNAQFIEAAGDAAEGVYSVSFFNAAANNPALKILAEAHKAKYSIILRATGAINFAQGDQVVIGGLIALTFITGVKLPLVAAILLALIIGGGVGLVYERLALRPTYKSGHISTVLASIGASLFFFHGMGLVWGRQTKPFPPFTGRENDVIDAMGVKVMIQSLWVFGLLALTLVLFHLFFTRTVYGKAMQAAATNELGAQLSGISPNRMKAYSMALASCLATLAGVMIAPFTLAGGAMAMPIAIKGFAGAMVGGLSSPIGVVAGGLIVGVVEAFAAGTLSSGYREPIAYSLLLLMLLVRPSGLFGLGPNGRS